MGLTASMRRSLRRVGVWDSPRLDLGLSQFTSTSFEKKKSTEKKTPMNMINSLCVVFMRTDVCSHFELHHNSAGVPQLWL